MQRAGTFLTHCSLTHTTMGLCTRIRSHKPYFAVSQWVQCVETLLHAQFLTHTTAWSCPRTHSHTHSLATSRWVVCRHTPSHILPYTNTTAWLYAQTHSHILFLSKEGKWVQYMCHCNTLQHTATYRNTLQHTATHYYTMQHTTTTTSSITLYLLTGGRWMQCTRAEDLHRRQRAGSC